METLATPTGKKRLRGSTRAFFLVLASLAALAVALYPIYVIRPFREQKPAALQRALWVQLHDRAVLVVLFLLITLLAVFVWRRAGWVARLLLVAPAVAIALLAPVAAWFNPYEQMMFHPFGESRYVSIQQAGIDGKDMVIAVTLGGESRAYPIREMGYHHIVNDRLHELPIVVTYWTLCHTGLVWTRIVQGRDLHFHLAGINNQNFIMRDEETGSYWQQINGTAIAGPLKGTKLTLVAQDELTFSLWKKEQPNGTVLAPQQRDVAKYEKATWESEIAKLPTVIHATKGTLPDRETVLGISLNGAARAFPLSKLTIASPVLVDEVGGKPVMLVLGPDGKSVRAFSRETSAGALQFYGRGGDNTSDPWVLLDSDTLSDWSFAGCAVSGPLKGQCLTRIDALKDFWFDWQHYHPASTIYRH